MVSEVVAHGVSMFMDVREGVLGIINSLFIKNRGGDDCSWSCFEDH